VTLALTLLPNGLIGLTISAILAATITSVDTQLNYLGSILVRDVYVKVRTTLGVHPPTERHQLHIGRVTAFALGLLAIVTAILVQRAHGVFDFALMYYSWFAPSMLMPVMLGLVYTKTPSWSAIASATAGLVVVWLVNVAFSVAPYQYEWNIFGGVFVSTVVFFLSGLWKEENADRMATLQGFRQDLEHPATDVALHWDPNALQSYKIIGVVTIGIGAVLLALELTPGIGDAAMLNAVAGICTIAFGIAILWYFKRQFARATSAGKGKP
jgi:Na+/proline symporter